MHITQIAIRRPVTTLMFSLALIFLGVVSYRELQVQRMPDIVFPSIGYSAWIKNSDATAEESNEELTIPIEKMVASLPGLKETSSVTRAGSFWGMATFRRGTDMRFRVVELQNRINKWLADKKDRVEARVELNSTEESGGFLAQLVLSVPAGQESRVAACSDLISRRLKSIDGITQVRVEGTIVPNLVLRAERDELVAAGVSERQIIDAINSRASDSIWLGVQKDGAKVHPVQLETKVASLDELLKVPLDSAGIRTVGGVAHAEAVAKEEERIFRINGKKAVSITVSKEKDRNTIQVARLVRTRIQEIEKELPPGFELTVTQDEAKGLEKIMKNLAEMALAGTILSMLVLLVFVRNWRIAMIVTVAIPTSILVTFNIMYAAHLSINILSLLGLSAGVGMLVDNSIVVVENVFRHSRLNRNAQEAAWLGSREVVRALFISTATNLIVFVPLAFIDDDLVLVMREWALSLVFPMLISLFVAMTIVPMLTSKVIGSGAVRRQQRRIIAADSIWARWNPWQKPNRKLRNYLREFVFFCTKGSLRHPIRLFSAIIVVLLFTCFAGTIKLALQRYQNTQGTRTITLFGKTRLGTRIEEADQIFAKKENQVRAAMKKTDAIKSFSSNFDKTGGTITLDIAEPYWRENRWTFFEAFEKLREGNDTVGFRFFPFPEASRSTGNQSGFNPGFMGGPQAQEQAFVTGENSDAMAEAADVIKRSLEFQEPVDKASIIIQAPAGNLEAHFIPDLELFRVMRVDPMVMRTFFEARDDRGVGTALTLEEGDIRRPVTVKIVQYDEDEKKTPTRQTLAQLKSMKVPLENGGVTTLDRLGSFEIKQSVPSISKKNRQRNIPIAFSLKPSFYRPGMEKTRQDTLRQIQDRLKDIRFPSGVSAYVAGALEDAKKEVNTWKKTLGLAVLMIFLVMAFSFESLVSPLIILLTLPLAFIGSIWAVIIFRADLNMVALFGSLILAGLVVNPGILLIEYIQQMQRQKGYRRSRALLFSVAYRLRPILMTTLTTVLGLLPILFSTEMPAEARSLVSVVVGGMVTSVLLTLVVIPTCYNSVMIVSARLQSIRLRAWNALRAKWLRLRARGPHLIHVQPKPALEMKELCIDIRNVTKIYPIFNKRKLLNFIPSRTHHYGCRPMQGKVAVKHLDLTIGPGMFGLLGPNGAGKTTLMQILTGIVPQDYGVIDIGGNDLGSNRQEIRNLISYLPQNFGVYGSLTLMQYLQFFAPFYGLNDPAERSRKIDEVAELVGLSEVKRKPMRRFSGGMRQRAGIAQMLLKPCPVMIVDEPTAGLDPVERVRFRLLLSQLARNRIVILSTHIVDDITSSCREVAVLNHGEIIYRGDLEQIKTSAAGLIWDITRPASERVPISSRYVLYRKHIADNILYHYVSLSPLPGSEPVSPNFEDAYVALLLKHDLERDAAGSSSQIAPSRAQLQQPILLTQSPEFSK